MAEKGSASTRSQVGLPLLNCAAIAPSVGPVPSSFTSMPVSLKKGCPIGLIVGLDRVAAPVDENQLLVGGARARRPQRQRRAAKRDRRPLRELASTDAAPPRLLSQDLKTVFLKGVVHDYTPVTASCSAPSSGRRKPLVTGHVTQRSRPPASVLAAASAGSVTVSRVPPRVTSPSRMEAPR